MTYREEPPITGLPSHLLILALLFLLVPGAARPLLAVTGPETCTPVLDSLGTATPATQFSVFGSGGTVISPFQLPGPAFTLTEDAVLNQIGAFVNNCKTIISGVPLCPDTSPLTVQIHPSLNGVPDPSTVLGTFVLSHDDDPLTVSFESADIHFPLRAGTYFALFAPQGQDVGFLLRQASRPFAYIADSVLLGFIQIGVRSEASQQFAAVRILADCRIPVTIDIKPGSFPNSVNPRSRGVIPVAIWTTDTFDAASVDPETLRFGATGTEAAAAQSALEDLDADGDLDLILHFRTEETGITCGATSALLTGKTSSSQPIEGADSIRTVGCR